jgi:hypothetical protein
MVVAMGKNLDWSKHRRTYSAWYERRDAFEDQRCERTPPAKPKKGKRRKRSKAKKFVPAKPLIRWVEAEPRIIHRRSDPPGDNQPPR